MCGTSQLGICDACKALSTASECTFKKPVQVATEILGTARPVDLLQDTRPDQLTNTVAGAFLGSRSLHSTSRPASSPRVNE